MLQPKNQKYRKHFQPDLSGKATKGFRVVMGDYGLQSLGRSWVTARQIEAARKTIVREMKRKGKLWIRVFPDRPITSKSGEVGMGKGKGDVDQYVAIAKPGIILFELGGVSEQVAREALRKAAQKLPIKTKFVTQHI
ncbi:50S ribosomal protein L16 [Candidatus Dojkabacteria bacterium]|uniref:Large ribosomal subunit protein uL16 n=1 Tax=Candidatus Dojkabacteria bacterium TaxID=2099670 RepID=A0A955L8T3_9BACT|nr:50S ribosomal protein L16 [Candidatus Dojkabacteria bacterium]